MADTEFQRVDKRFAQAKARLQRIRNRERTKQRKMDTRRKVILGGALLDLAVHDSAAAAMLDPPVQPSVSLHAAVGFGSSGVQPSGAAMILSLIQKIRTVLRYAFPTKEDRAYIAQMQAAGQFDRQYYLTATPNLKTLFRIWPERHYVQMGEANGLCPNPRFSPRAYLFNNPDLAQAAPAPLLHYMSIGQAQNRIVLAPLGVGLPDPASLPDITPSDRPDPSAPVAVLIHIYYADFWEEIAPLLAAQLFEFDLFITLTESPGTAALPAQIIAAFPQARVWQMPNHGRDIYPFVHLLNAGLFTPYNAVCKIHSKKSPHRADGEDWRRALIAGVLGTPEITQTRLKRFQADPNIGFWVSDGQIYEGDTWWGANRTRTGELMGRSGITQGHDLRFPAGSIYWIKPALLARLTALNLTPGDFEPEQALVDGTTAHAVERFLGALAEDENLRIVEASLLDKLDGSAP